MNHTQPNRVKGEKSRLMSMEQITTIILSRKVWKKLWRKRGRITNKDGGK